MIVPLLSSRLESIHEPISILYFRFDPAANGANEKYPTIGLIIFL